MLAIRMQRTGRRGHAMFRVIVQDSRRTPTSGKVVARLGSYDPHAKTVILDKEKAAFYLDHGAQPSDRVTRLLKDEGVKLPAWLKPASNKERAVRNADKRRSTRPAEAEAPAESAAEAASEAPAEAPAEPTEPATETSDEKPAEVEASDTAEASTDQKVTEETPAEKPESEEVESPAEEPAEAPADSEDSADQPADTPEA
jgi:small subunit ribosomal protein S16